MIGCGLAATPPSYSLKVLKHPITRDGDFIHQFKGINAMTAQILQFTDINTEVNHEPRILDVRLAEALGFSQSAQIRPLIERHKEALERFGEVFRTVRKTTSKGGRPSNENWLNKKQAIYICTKSETENATEITIHVVETFYAVRHGTLQPAELNLDDVITPHEQRMLQEAIKLKHEETNIAYPAMYERIKNKFRVAKYNQVTRQQLAEVMFYVCNMEGKQKALPKGAEGNDLIVHLLKSIMLEAQNFKEHGHNPELRSQYAREVITNAQRASDVLNVPMRLLPTCIVPLEVYQQATAKPAPLKQLMLA
jgi:hypothetical protein